MIGAADLPFEFMMNALRLTGGVALALFSERTGLPINVVTKTLAQAEDKQFVTRDHQHLAPTQKGQRFLNDLLELFLPDD